MDNKLAQDALAYKRHKLVSFPQKSEILQECSYPCGVLWTIRGRHTALIKPRHQETQARSRSKDEVTERRRGETMIFQSSCWSSGNMQPGQDAVSRTVEDDINPPETVFLLGNYQRKGESLPGRRSTFWEMGFLSSKVGLAC